MPPAYRPISLSMHQPMSVGTEQPLSAWAFEPVTSSAVQRINSCARQMFYLSTNPSINLATYRSISRNAHTCTTIRTQAQCLAPTRMHECMSARMQAHIWESDLIHAICRGLGFLHHAACDIVAGVRPCPISHLQEINDLAGKLPRAC